MPLTNIQIVNLRKKIAKKLPQTRLQLLDGPSHIYLDNVTGSRYISATTRMSFINNEHNNEWRVTRALEHAYDIRNQNISEKEFITQSKAHASSVFQGAGSIGTTIHQVIDDYLSERIRSGGVDLLAQPANVLGYVDGTVGEKQADYRVWSAIRGFQDFEEEYRYIPLASEIKVWNEKYKIAGTIDGVGLIAHRDFGSCIAILDWKTSNQFQATYSWQTAIYWYMFWKLTGIKPERVMIVKLDKEKGMYKAEFVANPEIMADQYIQFCQTYDNYQELHRLREDAKPKPLQI